MTNKDNLCQVEGCKNLARFSLYKLYPDGRKQWLYVCPPHDIIIAEASAQVRKALQK